jgi:hypothetical protein
MTLPVWFREKRLRRLSQAKLEIAKVVTRMESLMSAGRIKMGDACHDHLYKVMIHSQCTDHRTRWWKLWRPLSDRSKELRKQLHEEISADTDLAKLLVRFVNADFKAFANQRPFVACAFVVWIILLTGGIAALIVGLISVVRAKEAWQKAKQLTAEWFLILAIQRNPQFRLENKGSLKDRLPLPA